MSVDFDDEKTPIPNILKPQPMKKSKTSPLAKKGKHKPQSSVSALVPANVWGKVPALMKLLDHQKQNNLALPNHYQTQSALMEDESSVQDTEDLTLVKKDSLDIIKQQNNTQQNNTQIENNNNYEITLLADKAAEEFQQLIYDNENKSRENETLKIKLQDANDEIKELKKRIDELENDTLLMTDIQLDMQTLKSKNSALEMEKNYLQETLQEIESRVNENNNNNNNNNNIGSLNSDTGDILDKINKNVENKQKNDNEKYYLQKIQSSTQKYLELQSQFESQSEELKHLRLQTVNLKKKMNAKDLKINELSKDLDTQQKNYLQLKELQGNRIDTLEQQTKSNKIFAQSRVRALTKEAETQKNENAQLQLALMQTKAELATLQAEKADMLDILEELDDVQQKKIADDDGMFEQLRHFKNLTQHGLAFDQGSLGNVAKHLRSESNYSVSTSNWYGFNNYDDNKIDDENIGSKDQYLGVKSVRKLKLLDETSQQQASTQTSMHGDIPMIDKNPSTPTQNDSVVMKISSNEYENLEKKLEEQKKKTEEAKKKAELELEKRKRLELAKISAEMEFFILTCLSVKKNLVEEYMEVNSQIEEALIGENPVELFKIAQETSIPMHHFSIWCEQRIREKYDLPKMKRFSTRFKFKWQKTEEAVRDKWKKLELGNKIKAFGSKIKERARGLSVGARSPKPADSASPVMLSIDEEKMREDADEKDALAPKSTKDTQSNTNKDTINNDTNNSEKDGKTDTKENGLNIDNNNDNSKEPKPPNDKCCLIM